MTWHTDRVVVGRDNPHDGDVACAYCDNPSTLRVFLDGLPWSTTCGRHLYALVNAARYAIGLPHIPAELAATLAPTKEPPATT